MRFIHKAPLKLLKAGLGDMLAKYVSICEWRVAHLLLGEYYCPEIAELIQEMIKKVQNGEDVNIEEFFSELKEQYPDLVDTIEMYWEIIKQFGVDQLAALLTSAE